jgi:hypothetical protein
MSDTHPNNSDITDHGEGDDSNENLFPVDALPPVIRELCRRLADLHGVPVAFPAALAIAVLGGAVGKGLQVDTWRGLKTFPNVYVLTGVLSGLAKSTVGTPIFAPLAQCETKHQQQHAKALPMIESELMLVQKQIAALIKQGQKNE